MWNLYNFGKKIFPLEEGFNNIANKLFSTKQALGAKTPKKCFHIDVLEVIAI
jgi:hypothetical protein